MKFTKMYGLNGDTIVDDTEMVRVIINEASCQEEGELEAIRSEMDKLVEIVSKLYVKAPDRVKEEIACVEGYHSCEEEVKE